jgi:hypothetical protein
MLGRGRGLAACGVRCGCCWCGWRRTVCVGSVGLFMVGVAVCSGWVMCEKCTLAVQDLVCDGCR